MPKHSLEHWDAANGVTDRAIPRMCVLSLRGVVPHMARCSAFEFEDVVCEMEGADLFAPQTRPQPRQPSRLLRVISGRTPWTVTAKPTVEPIRVVRPYDVAIAMVQSPADLVRFQAFQGWRENSRVAICYVEEVWQGWIEQYSGSKSPIHLLKDFDYVFLNCLRSVDAMRDVIGRPVHYIAPGIDALRFRPVRERRSTDVYYMGRRSTTTHEALIRLLEAGEISYAFDSVDGLNVEEVRQHRLLLAGAIQNSRYFIVQRAKANVEVQTTAQEELGFRYFEGAAAGAVMIGSAPRVESFDHHFDWPDAVIPMEYDYPEIGELIAELDGQPERMERIRRENVVQSLRRHDWCHRWSEILETVGLSVSDGVGRRRSRLDAAVDQVKRLYSDRTTA